MSPSFSERSPAPFRGRRPPRPPGPRDLPIASNQDQQAALAGGNPTPAPAQDAAAPAQAPAAATVTLDRTLKLGASGEDVKALQRFLGLEDDGDFGPGTKAALAAWQARQGLEGDGVAGPDTRTVLAGGKLTPHDPLKSRYHDDSKFVPTYRATAQSESDQYRTQADPYAVGAVTKPDKEDDLGGKTYGTYQFESYVYKDGTHASDALRDKSTVMRFVRWDKNPYGKELQEVVKAHGVASAQFDQAWAELTTRDNKGFGKAQEDFLLLDVKAKVDAWFDKAGVDANARKDPELFDVVLGTLNQYDSLANGMAEHVAAKQKAAGKTLTADEIGVALQEYKWDKVTTHFKSSPKAHSGIRNRINREGALFDGYERKPHPRK
ncbi:peptidoglycan-binding protein [Myxococcota bacterium]|nr:peptidoglycan-binding protein [Myxococcota bacterium]